MAYNHPTGHVADALFQNLFNSKTKTLRVYIVLYVSLEMIVYKILNLIFLPFFFQNDFSLA